MTDIITKDKGCGYKDDEGKTCMIRCFDCGKENYAINVPSGYCTWCGFNANEATQC